jgi:hypothetical protein
MKEIPIDQHITYQLQYRKCGKASCSTCRNGQGHGPYWYAYWREGPRLKSGYVGKIHPSLKKSSPPRVEKREAPPADIVLQDIVPTPALI